MFSYRHAFHAGNHADVLKHTILIAVLRYMTEKDAALNVIDTHAGAGLYRLDGDYANKSGESTEGVQKLASEAAKKSVTLVPALADYLEMIQGFNNGPGIKVYPGSPFIIQKLIGDRDRLKAFELHPTDSRALSGNLAQLEAGRQVAVLVEDGFEGIKKFLPPPSRRALVLCDPSYELKTDYGRVQDMVAEGLRRLVTGTFAIWYPIIPRTEAHDLPKRLKTMATKLGKPWLHATLSVKGGKIGQGLAASGMFLINPPYTLKDQLKLALPQMVELLGQDANAAFALESGS